MVCRLHSVLRMKYTLALLIFLVQVLAFAGSPMSSSLDMRTTSGITYDLKAAMQDIPAVRFDGDLSATASAVNPHHLRSRTFRLPIDSDGEMVLAGTALMITAIMVTPEGEQKLLHAVQSTQSPGMDKVMNAGRKFGETKTAIALAGASMVYALVVDENQTLMRIVPVQFAAIAAVGFANNLFKVIFHRALPKESPDDPFARSQYNNPSRLALPSGHTAAAVAAATIIAENFKDSDSIVPTLAYSAAILTGISRVYHNEHWVTDVLASIYAHYLTKYIIRYGQSSGREILMMPTYGEDGYGFRLTFRDKGPQGVCGDGLIGNRRMAKCISDAFKK